jgi:AraC-like DNA-binding protein
MPWRDIQYSIPLDAKPTVLQMAVGIHGPNDVRRYRFELWCIHLYCYEGELYLDGQYFPIRPGYVGIMPPGATSETHFHDLSRHTFAHFTLPPTPEGSGLPILAMQDVGEDFAALNQSFEEALSYFSTQPRRTEVRLWDILWQLAERTPVTPAQSPRLHPAVQKAIQSIEVRLADPIRVTDLAREVELSHNHLTRLFRASLGKTVTGYIQERRVQRARHLLLHSTLSIKAIAAEVGINDLHLFNKTIRRVLGDSPRRVRASRLRS